MEQENPHTVLRARIALLATAIGGPDYTSDVDPPPYKLGDDCLACLKDLKRWFKLVDDQQNTWEVAMAAAEYKIFTDDLIPILIDWENKSCKEAKILKKRQKQNLDDPNQSSVPIMKNKIFHDKIALHCLQLMVLMTWPLIITEHSSSNQVNYYADLKKYQLIYKKAILLTENGKALKAVNRLVINVMKIDRLSRSPRDNMIIKLALNFFRNLIAIEPGEIMITSKRQTKTGSSESSSNTVNNKGIKTTDSLPPNVSLDDISLNTLIKCFHENKVLSLILTLSSSLNTEFDQDFINIPILEIMFYLTKDINPKLLFKQERNKYGLLPHSNESEGGYQLYTSIPEMELKDLLKKELQMKKHLIRNTSSRHSRFGALISIQTDNQTRLTVSGTQSILNESTALNKLDSRKRWSKRVTRIKDDPLEEGLPNNLLNSQGSRFLLLQGHIVDIFTNFINNFIDSSFNILLHSITNYITTEQDKIVMIEHIEYLLFYAWFLKYQMLRCSVNQNADLIYVSEALKETSFILVSHLLRTSFDMRNWIVVHAAMIAFNELLLLVNNEKNNDADSEDIEFILSRLFSDERIQLLSNIPKTAIKHTTQYMMSCIDLTHTVLKILEQYSSDNNKLVITGKRKGKRNLHISEADIEKVMEEDKVERDEAIDILTPSYSSIEVDFKKVQRSYINDFTIETYITFLRRFRELESDQIKKIIAFFHRVFIQAKEEAYLFRLDLIVLLHDMLSEDGIEKSARVRKHVKQFTNYYLQRLKSRIKKSPSWIIELLFPSIHDSELSYYQRYGEKKPQSKNPDYSVPESLFEPLPDEKMLPPSTVKDMKFGILVATLIDESKSEYIDKLIEHISKCIDIFKSWLTVNILNENETASPPDEKFTMSQEFGNPILSDRDLRALLKLIGYNIPMSAAEACYLPGSLEISQLEEALDLLKKYTTTTFETPNGLAASTYLIRPRKVYDYISGEEDGWTGSEQYDLTDPNIVHDNEIDDNDYFRDLDDKIKIHTRENNPHKKGIAASRKKDSTKKSKNSVTSKKRNNPETLKPQKQQSKVFSKEYVDSDDSDDEDQLNPIFFENEMYLRWLLDKNGGQLSSMQHNIFGKFIKERIDNNGSILSDFSELFNGHIPPIESLHRSNTIGEDISNTIISTNKGLGATSLKQSSPDKITSNRNVVNSMSSKNISDEEDTFISDNDYNSEIIPIENSNKRTHEDGILTSNNLEEEEIQIRKSKIRKIALSNDEEE